MDILHKDNFVFGPISIDQVEPNLFLGSLSAAKDIETLHKYKITHIITIDTCPLPRNILDLRNITFKYIQLSDQPKEDLLSHLDNTYSFIQQALTQGGTVFVHCYFGVSRSATVVIAYVMKKYQISYAEAFDKIYCGHRNEFGEQYLACVLFDNIKFVQKLLQKYVKNYLEPYLAQAMTSSLLDFFGQYLCYKVKSKRRIVFPNQGFVSQLKLYKEMSFKVDNNDMRYKLFRLNLAADRVRKVKILPQEFIDLIQPDPGLPMSKPDPNVYRCKKCRRILASESNLIVHKDKGVHCTKTFFIEPIAWMNAAQVNQGKLHCPKCDHKVGSFSWIAGSQCPCGTQVAPAFYLVPSKVDYTNVVKNVELTF